MNKHDLPVFSALRQPTILRRLIENGYDINITDEEDNTPLHLSVCSPDIVKLLIDNGADVNAKNKKEETPLHLAAMNGDHELVAYLLENGANAYSANANGETPLHLVAYANAWYHKLSDYIKVAKYLIEYGGGINTKTNVGNTPLMLAKQHKTHSKLIEFLTENGAC